MGTDQWITVLSCLCSAAGASGSTLFWVGRKCILREDLEKMQAEFDTKLQDYARKETVDTQLRAMKEDIDEVKADVRRGFATVENMQKQMLDLLLKGVGR